MSVELEKTDEAMAGPETIHVGIETGEDGPVEVRAERPIEVRVERIDQ